MDLILVSGHPVPIFKTQNKKIKKKLSRVCLSKRNIFATIFFFVCVLEIQSRMDR
jgi:DUF438 domain-containing protein